MGSVAWNIGRDDKPKAKALDYVREVISGEVVDHSFQPAYSHEWGGVLYAAIGNADGEVWGLVALFGVHNDSGGRSLAVKLVDETMGPLEVSAPMRILSHLTPTDHEYANTWRANVAEFHQRRRAARAMIGSTLTFAHSLSYGEPVGEIDTVEVHSMTTWRDPQSGYRLKAPPQWWQRTWHVA